MPRNTATAVFKAWRQCATAVNILEKIAEKGDVNRDRVSRSHQLPVLQSTSSIVIWRLGRLARRSHASGDFVLFSMNRVM